MPHGPTGTAPSAELPTRPGISLPGRHHPPPLTPLGPLAAMTSLPARYRSGRPADSVMWIVFDDPSVMSVSRTSTVLDMMPTPADCASPAETSRGSTP